MRMPHSSIGQAVGLAQRAGAGHRQPGVGHAPAKVGRALAVVHVAIDLDAVDFLHVLGEELGDVLIGRPVDRHAEVVAVLGLELLLEVWPVEPVLAEPVEVGELLVGQLVELAVRAGRELDADEVGEVERRDWSRPCHSPAIQSVRLTACCRRECVPIRSRVVDVGVVEIAVGLHLRLDRLDDFAFAEDLVVDLDAGDFLEGLGQHLRFVVMRRNAFRQHVDLHALEGLGRLDEPFHFLQLLFLRKRRRLEFGIDPLLGCFDVGKGWSSWTPRAPATAADAEIRSVFIVVLPRALALVYVSRLRQSYHSKQNECQYENVRTYCAAARLRKAKKNEI